MKTLYEHNIETNNHKRVGVACDKCGKEMIYADNPAPPHTFGNQFLVRCLSCGFSGMKHNNYSGTCVMGFAKQGEVT